ncbi:silencing information regulator [Aaosphaeria arxii CBS 175.79]|uniref:Silencing information regulator n=1 Tax=Aaosphaeria arxii CBS 175.79 TaxID=1450172 RepID=A0A6A5Y959_9PLEO|nr:silencing information regulator [Aaosphaeria arxii CBS 175.79]KAF2021773.1 silencing information regulator [Aaosphaeria arxii CBS 175.79]
MPPPQPLLRVPYTKPFPPPTIIPTSATTASGAIAALVDFLSAPASTRIRRDHFHHHHHDHSLQHHRHASATTNTSTNNIPQPFDTRNRTLILTGAGISVSSGLADYRGTNGTYTLNRTYKPIYFNEFCASHEARKRYWARSFLGWTNLNRARPNVSHAAVGRLGELGVVGSCITQNVDSFHPLAHPSLQTLELHGYLRALVCLSCGSSYPRSDFQSDLARLNPAWSTFLEEMLASGALDTENPDERRRKGMRTNPDGDVDVPGAPYGTFRYPACPVCLAAATAGRRAVVKVDDDGAWATGSTGGILKPAVVMFGESIAAGVKLAAEQAVDTASRMLVVGSSLATYSAWRLVKRAKEQGLPIAILNIGGVRGEDTFFADVPETNTGRDAVRAGENADKVLPQVVKIMEDMQK